MATIFCNAVRCITFRTVELSWSVLAVCPYMGIATLTLPMVVFGVVVNLTSVLEFFVCWECHQPAISNVHLSWTLSTIWRAFVSICCVLVALQSTSLQVEHQLLIDLGITTSILYIYDSSLPAEV